MRSRILILALLVGCSQIIGIADVTHTDGGLPVPPAGDASVRCGDGIVQAPEECDDGNTIDGDGCEHDCTLPRCGNRIVDPGEACDDGNTVDGDGCSHDCKSTEQCGNAIVDPGEECDHGQFSASNPTGNNNSNDCRADCQLNRCGDGFVDNQSGLHREECDGGHLVGLMPVPTETADCNIDCTLPRCGDQKINQTAGEQCDDGTNNSDNKRCTASCKLNVCGDGHVLVGVEQCDDGNTVNGDGCENDCTLPRCGNNIRDPGEQCDDGNTVNGDGCENDCTLPRCGNNIVDMGEQCDNGGVDTATCDSDCTRAVCGDGHVNFAAGEECDDGANNGKTGDHCSTTCHVI